MEIGTRIEVISGGMGAYCADGMTGTVCSEEEVKSAPEGSTAGELMSRTAPLYIKIDKPYKGWNNAELVQYIGLCEGFEIKALEVTIKLKEPKMATIEQLAPYLPYGLVCRSKDWSVDHVLISLSHTFGWFSFGPVAKKVYLRDFKPLLRPMDRLTQEELRKAGFDSHIDYLTHELQSENKSENPQRHQDGKRVWRIERAPFEMVQWLIQNHYDYQDLIGQGLALVKEN